MTTAGWALLVMVAVTALAAWPVTVAPTSPTARWSATLGVVHDAVGPPRRGRPGRPVPLDDDPDACKDNRPPAVRASDTAVETMLYRNWLRGVLGSADSETAQKYGPALYDAQVLHLGRGGDDPRATRRPREQTISSARTTQWMKVAEQIKTEDPEAYEYLQGVKGMERIGAGFIAMLAAVMFAMFDLTASLLVLLGFLIFRWAVIAAPILGTVGLLRPASAGFRRLANAVVAAVFNIVIFGTGAAIYLFAVDLIMNTPTPARLAAGRAGLAVRRGRLAAAAALPPDHPARRQGQQRRGRARRARGTAGSSATCGRPRSSTPAEPGGTDEPQFGKRRTVVAEQTTLRPEARLEDPGSAPQPAADRAPERPETRRTARQPRRPAGRPRRASARADRRSWAEPDVADAPTSYAIYRPDSAQEPRAGAGSAAAGALRGEVIACGGSSSCSRRRRCGPGVGVAIVLARRRVRRSSAWRGRLRAGRQRHGRPAAAGPAGSRR